jgi:hypothetical protein
MFSPADQFGHLQGMANNVMSAIQNENDSRVAQAREMRRMQHEKEMAQMRMAAEQSRVNDLISRLGGSAGGLPTLAQFEGGAIYHNPYLGR